MKTIPPEAAWACEYVGLPFKFKGRDRDGVDCYGLLRLVLMEKKGLALPLHPHKSWNPAASQTARARAAVNITRWIEQGLSDWLKVTGGRVRVFDGLRLLEGGAKMHMGLVVSPGWMLHAYDGSDAAIEPYGGPPDSGVEYNDNRIEGIYRHVALA